MGKKRISLILILIVLIAVLAGCDLGADENDNSARTQDKPGPFEEKTASVVIETDEVETSDEEEDKTLIICVAQDPESLFIPHDWNTSKEVIYQALYDGGNFGYDLLDFSYEPVILTKLPNLADGDAVIETVTVNEGDMIMLDGFTLVELKPPHVKEAEDGDMGVNAEGKPIVIEFGMSDWIRPSGCESSDCAVPYVGNPVKIDQPGVKYRPAGCRDDSCLKPYMGGSVEMDRLVVYYSFRPDLTWSDGTKVTAADSVFGFELGAMGVSVDGRDPTQYKRIQSYTAVDDFIVEMKTVPGYLGSTYPVNFWVPLPAHQWSEYTYRQLASGLYLENFVSYGPYQFEEYHPGDKLILSKNPYYFKANEGLPYFDTLIYRFVGLDASVNSAGLISGECDILDTTTLLDDRVEFLNALSETGIISAKFVTSAVWEHLDFGIIHSDYDDGFDIETDRPNLFDDVRTRQGIAYCIDRQGLIDSLLFGQSKVLDSYIPSSHPLSNANIPQYNFDVGKGAALLAEAGWIYGSDGIRIANGVKGVPDGTRLELDLYTTVAVMRQHVSSQIKETLAKCGVDVNVSLMSPGDLFMGGVGSAMFGRNFDLVEFAWMTDVEPPCDLFVSSVVPSPVNNWDGYNVTGYSNPAFDNACSLALSSLPGEEEYYENHLLAQKIFAEDLPVYPLFQRIKMAASRVDLCGYILDQSAWVSTWNIENFMIGEDCK